MSDEVAIKVDHVNKTFRLPHEKAGSVKTALINFARHKRGYEKQHVLKDVSFEVKKGEFFGIVGRNGSGKSTLLKLLAGIYTPDSGSIQINGKLTPFIELGVGFNQELTGRENVFLNGALLGFNRKEMQAMYKDIVDFAELHRFMDQKLKNYSSGMQVRLAFSIAIRAQSDILILDEVLAVGDAAFQKKCYDHFMLLKKNQQTVVLVTHDMGAVRQYCDRAMMIDGGKIVSIGVPEKVAQAYQRLFINELTEQEKVSKASSDDEVGARDHWGSGKMRCLRPKIEKEGKSLTLICRYRANVDLLPPVFGFTVYGPSGNNVLEGNTKRMHYKTTKLLAKQIVEILWVIPDIFATGTYNVSVACCDESTTEFYDWLNDAAHFKILKEGSTAGVVDPELRIKNYQLMEK